MPNIDTESLPEPKHKPPLTPRAALEQIREALAALSTDQVRNDAQNLVTKELESRRARLEMDIRRHEEAANLARRTLQQFEDFVGVSTVK